MIDDECCIDVLTIARQKCSGQIKLSKFALECHANLVAHQLHPGSEMEAVVGCVRSEID